jgi:hypothetical protein
MKLFTAASLLATSVSAFTAMTPQKLSQSNAVGYAQQS